jgi:hypothetical protein
MNKGFILVCSAVIIISCLLGGCSSTNNTSQGHDSRFVGQWQNQQTGEILTFYSDGTYNLEEGETANWSTADGGKLSMYNSFYSYLFSENNTVLTLTQESVTKIYKRL